jgi:hypothetical protein
MLKKSFLLILSFFLCQALPAQTFQWAKRAGLWAFDLGFGIGCDNAGNVYISGKYEMNANFGGSVVTCAGNHDIYTAKYGPAGDFKWVRTAGGPNGDYSHAMAVDGAGNSYVTGEIESTVSFGSGVSLTSNGDNDIFIAKYNTNGSLVWARKLGGGTKSDKGLGISLFGSSVYVTGKFVSTGNFAGTTLASAGGADIFVAKYTSDGVFQWVRRAGGTGNDEGYAIANDAVGNLYVTGYFSSTAGFSGQNLTSKGGTDIFIAKYNSSGSLVWVKGAGGTAHDYGMGIKADNSSRVYLTGGFRVKSTFGTYTLNASGGNADIFVARYDGNGNPSWVRKAGGTLNDYGRALALDANSNIYITGNYGSTATFSNTSITAADSTDVYFASWGPDGNFRWVLKSGGVQDKSDPGRYIEMGLSIATDPSGNVVASGTYRSNSTFGSTTLAAWDHTDIFITKITQQSSFRTSEAMAKPAITPPDSATFCSGGSVWLKTTQDTSCSYQWLLDGRVLQDATGSAFKAQEPGSYKVMTVKGEDTLYSEVTVVKVTNRITSTIKCSGTRFCRDSSMQLTAPLADDFVYQWKRNGRSIRGANTATLVPERDGNYQVRIIQGSCFDWSDSFRVKFENCGPADSALHKTTDIHNEGKDDSLLVYIYPNPNSGLFTLELNLRPGMQTGAVNVEVINSVGQIVYQKAVPIQETALHQQVELDRTASSGVYFLRVTVGEITEVQRMLLLK